MARRKGSQRGHGTLPREGTAIFQPMHHDSVRAVHAAARRAASEADAPLLLAVSGGLDSMALLSAMASAAPGRIAAVATFDHATGPFAAQAAAHVMREAGALGLPVVTARMLEQAALHGGLEATWRRHRHAFLREAAETLGAVVVTAHTEDDQVETVLMRELRGSGARGLAGLYADGDIVRPYIAIRRETLERYVAARGVRWVDDPGNAGRAHLRNRVRHDLLPALRAADPAFDTSLLATARAAADWRAAMDDFVRRSLRVEQGADGSVSVASMELAGYDRDSLSVVWNALASVAGLALDRRGTRRLATFTIEGASRGVVPLSGGWCVEADGGKYRLRRAPGPAEPAATLPVRGAMCWGSFRFHEVDEDASGSAWVASLPAEWPAQVRAWRDGDRLSAAGGHPRRRVKRYLSEAGVRGIDRAGWPVVVAGDAGEVLWIPGVRRSDAATARSGRPVRHYVCERIVPHR